MSTATQITLPTSGEYAHIVKSVSLGTIRTKCGTKCNSGVATLEQATAWGYALCGKCVASNGTTAATVERCTECNCKLSKRESGTCQDCKATAAYKAR